MRTATVSNSLTGSVTRCAIMAGFIVLSALATGCKTESTATTIPSPSASSKSNVQGAGSSQSATAKSAEKGTIDLRLFGRVALTEKPLLIIDPMQISLAPTFEKGEFTWTPRATFQKRMKELEEGTFAFGVSIQEADGLYPSLTGTTVADVGAGLGNNLPAWKEKLGPGGRLYLTDVDIHAARFMAYAAKKIGYADRTLVIANRFEDPCLPLGKFDLVLLSNVHSHITVGPDIANPNPDEARRFYKESKMFLRSIRRALRSDRSLLIVMEGDQKTNFLNEDGAIANIEKNGFHLTKKKRRGCLWTAAFEPIKSH